MCKPIVALIGGENDLGLAGRTQPLGDGFSFTAASDWVGSCVYYHREAA
jgi:hypothetical protein